MKVKVTQSCPTLCDPGQNSGMGSPLLLQGIFPTPGIKPRSPALQVASLPAEPQGKPKNTGVGSLGKKWKPLSFPSLSGGELLWFQTWGLS